MCNLQTAPAKTMCKLQTPPARSSGPARSSRSGATYSGGWNSTVKEFRRGCWGPRAWKIPVFLLAVAFPIQLLADESDHCANLRRIQDKLEEKKGMYKKLGHDLEHMYEQESCPL